MIERTRKEAHFYLFKRRKASGATDVKETFGLVLTHSPEYSLKGYTP